jgi:hypothetical protein
MSFDEAFQRMDATLVAMAGKTVSYRRGEAQVDWKCFVGSTASEGADPNSGVITRYSSQDYIGPVADLILDDEPITPRQGDRIYDTIGETCDIYEVQPPKGSKDCFEYSDPLCSTVRIHTKYIESLP